MVELDSDDLAEQLQDNLDTDRAPDDTTGQAFHALGYIKSHVDDETEEALDVLSDLMHEM